MRLDGDRIDPDTARLAGCTTLQIRVIELWNEDSSWRTIAATLGITITSARKSWAAANRRTRGGANPATDEIKAARPDATSHPDLIRGIPLLTRGITGTIPGTQPGDPAWRAIADQ